MRPEASMRISVRLGLLALAASTILPGCTRSKSRELIDSRVFFFEKRADGRYVREDSHGRVVSVLDIDATGGFVIPTPDGSGYFQKRIGAPMAQASAVIVVGGQPLALPWSDDLHLTWTSPDGRSFVLQQGTELWLVSVCDGQLDRRQLSSDVKASFVTKAHVLVLHENAQTLEWIPWLPEGAKRIVTVGAVFDAVMSDSDAGRVVVARVVSASPRRLHFWTVGVSDGRAEGLTPPGDPWVVEAMPLLGTSRMVIEVLRDGVHLDGVPKTEFLGWDYTTGATDKLRENPHGVQLFDLPANVVTMAPSCGRPTS
jgi:hypothetical protein